ncbi:succinate--hydroxymethylglutarate CoA-transferase [Athalia rosae]|uniref:succinate--hydroxymethylglutarate CoA-transferase n=1 Tax=Athalia rosae TaxID=37344 RepID=UPI00203366B3|nr:succinate--hydroxymethylglutarate CoA-transferase [Athalia rosae]
MYKSFKFLPVKRGFEIKKPRTIGTVMNVKCFSTSIEDTSPLSGIRIMDLTRIIAGPYCTMVLGDLGAEILKIERPVIGDESRRWGPPFFKGTKEGTYFSCVNRNKKSICIDLKRGKDILYELAKKSDVLVENYVPGKLGEMGLDYETLKRVAPRLIYCSITGYGYKGSYTSKPGYDVIASSLGGLLHITGPKDGEPCKVGVAMVDIATGLYAHGAIMAALLQRVKNNKGQWIQCDLLSTQVASLINIGSNYLNAGKEASRWGTAHESIVPYEAFPTKNGYISVGAGSDIQFSALLKKMNLEELEGNSKFCTNVDRVKNRIELIGILRSHFQKKTSEEWSEIFEDAPFPNGRINTISQVFDDPHIKDINLVKEMSHPTIGKLKVVGPAVSYSYAKNSVRSPPPLLGQHTKEVLRNVLDYSDEKISKLIKEKIIQ